MVQDAYFLEGEADMQKLLGTVVRNPITAGEPITQGSLVAPGDRGFLAAALGPGMRAVTIPVSARTGVAGFVFPGDHIDLVLTQTVKGMIPSRSRPPKRSSATCACSPPTSRPRRKPSKARPRSRPSARSPWK
jgi:Flp pilus assembly protein CpaB